MQDQDAFECAVVEQVASRAPISFDELQLLFKGLLWNCLFAVTDRLSRQGILAIRRVDHATYLVSLGPLVPTAPNAPNVSSRSPLRS